MTQFIAERHLLFSEKNDGSRKNLTIRVSAPSVVKPEAVNFPVDGVASVCRVEVIGLTEYSHDVHGMDSMQAINLASDIESLIRRLSSNYDIFWATGEPYFDEV